jgi:hypothetical protein
MRINPGSVFLIFLLIVMAVFIGIASTFSSFQSKLLPILVCGLVFVLGAVQLRKELSTRKQTTEGASGEEQGKGNNARLGFTLAWLFGFALAIYLLGFLLAIPAFIFCYIKLRGRSWVASLATAAITTGFAYMIFEFALKAELWKGLIFANL